MRLFTLKHIILYAAAMAILLVLLQWMQFKLLLLDHAIEIYIAGIAVIFTILGIWLAPKLIRRSKEFVKETIVLEKEVVVYKDAQPAPVDRQMIKALALSERELEMLQLMAAGYSNQEIADRLFLSLNTIKTHCSRLFEKLDVSRRTQVIEKAKRLNIIS